MREKIIRTLYDKIVIVVNKFSMMVKDLIYSIHEVHQFATWKA